MKSQRLNLVYVTNVSQIPRFSLQYKLQMCSHYKPFKTSSLKCFFYHKILNS